MRKYMRAFILILLVLVVPCWGAEQKFYTDDPIAKEDDPQDASGVKPWDIGLVYDFLENFFANPGDRTPGVRAQNINTIDEVPDSNWYENRTGLTPESVAKGSDTTSGPAPGTWTVTGAKSNGVTPGFTIKDSIGQKWFIKFDPPSYPGMATGTEVVVTKLFWALGYHVPENHLSTLRVENLTVGDGAKITPLSGKKRPMKISDIKKLLWLAAKNEDGSYRVIASKALPGKPLGGFRFYGTRPDDPNDVVPHEHRRELRGYGVFAAWLNHVDSKSINSLDTVIEDNGKSFVRHFLLDFGATLGSASLAPHEEWEGYECLYEGQSQVGRDLVAVGLHVEPWRRVKYYEGRSIGRFQQENENWDPDSWMPREPNPAFLRSRADDKFWAARKLMGLTDEMIRMAVSTGQFNDSKSEEFLANALIQRRNAIGRKYLTAINPIVDPVLDSSGILTFGNAAAAAGFVTVPPGYQAMWYRFDNSNGDSTLIGETSGSAEWLEPPANLPAESGAFVKIDISLKDGAPVHAYFHRTDSGWKLVGFERMP